MQGDYSRYYAKSISSKVVKTRKVTIADIMRKVYRLR